MQGHDLTAQFTSQLTIVHENLNATQNACLSQQSRVNVFADSVRTLRLQLDDIDTNDPRRLKLEVQLELTRGDLAKAEAVLCEMKESFAFAQTTLRKAEQRLDKAIEFRAFPLFVGFHCYYFYDLIIYNHHLMLICPAGATKRTHDMIINGMSRSHP